MEHKDYQQNPRLLVGFSLRVKAGGGSNHRLPYRSGVSFTIRDLAGRMIYKSMKQGIADDFCRVLQA